MKFVSQFGSGATDRQFVDFDSALDAQRFALEYACMRRSGHFLSQLVDRGLSLKEFPIRRLLGVGAFRQQLKLARYIGRRRIQIVHSYDFSSNVFAIPAAWWGGAPVIIASIRDRGVDLTPTQRRVQRAMCRFADCVIVDAESIREWLIGDGYDPSNIVVIHNGIDVTRFSGGRRSTMRAQLGICESAPVVGMMARFRPTKRIEDFIDAAAIVSWNLPDVCFLIVADRHEENRGRSMEDAAYRRSILDRVRRLGLQDKVKVAEFRSDAAAVLAEMDVSVLPSLNEGLSNVLLESMAAGVPVVAARVGGTPEAVEHGENGLLVPPSDPQGLATAIARLVTERNLASRLAATGRQFVRDRFGMDRMVRATEQLYLDLLVRKAAQPGWRGRIGLARHAFETIPEKRSWQ